MDLDRWNAMGEAGFIKAVGHQIPNSITLIDADKFQMTGVLAERYTVLTVTGWNVWKDGLNLI